MADYSLMPEAVYSTYVIHKVVTQSLQLLHLSLFFLQTPLSDKLSSWVQTQGRQTIKVQTAGIKLLSPSVLSFEATLD